MLDIQVVRDQPEIVKKACRDKQLDETVVDKLLEVDTKRRALLEKVEKLRHQGNQTADAIKKQVSAGEKPASSLIEQGKEIKNALKELDPELRELESTFHTLLYQLPNIPADNVPIGSDESGNIVIRTEGSKPDFDFNPKPHHELMQDLDLLDTVQAVKIAGFRSYFLKNQAVLLEQAVLNYALKMLIDEGFSAMTAPVLVNQETMWGTGYFPWGAEDHYQTQDDTILAGTSEVALTAYHMGKTLTYKDLPIKMVGISPCFRREVGAHGKDTQGIIRVHQFMKVEQVVYTTADEAETISWHETMLGLSERLLQDLELHYQVLLMCSGDMGAGQRKKYDIETWFPSQNTFRETNSASYFNDFQSRRLNIKYQDKDGQTKYVYTLNNTMAASPRLLAAIIENYQQPDGSIRVPTVLQPFVGSDTITT